MAVENYAIKLTDTAGALEILPASGLYYNSYSASVDSAADLALRLTKKPYLCEGEIVENFPILELTNLSGSTQKEFVVKNVDAIPSEVVETVCVDGLRPEGLNMSLLSAVLSPSATLESGVIAFVNRAAVDDPEVFSLVYNEQSQAIHRISGE
jgi:hypothetical protein